MIVYKPKTANLPNLFSNSISIDSITEPSPTTMTALHQFGEEMIKLSRELNCETPTSTISSKRNKSPVSSCLETNYAKTR